MCDGADAEYIDAHYVSPGITRVVKYVGCNKCKELRVMLRNKLVSSDMEPPQTWAQRREADRHVQQFNHKAMDGRSRDGGHNPKSAVGK